MDETLGRIREALDAAAAAISPFVPGAVKADQKSAGRGPVTEADRASDRVLHEILLCEGEGWLSEETADDLTRLKMERVWVVDPLDGTLEFVAGIPEWCISIALIANGKAVAGGISNPATKEIFLGSLEAGLTYNGQPARSSSRTGLDGAVVLASRSEIKRREWEEFRGREFEVRPTGSVAYKLALVAAGHADATWTLTPKNEWDIAAGVALIEAGGGFVSSLENTPLTFNNRSSLLPGLLAGGPRMRQAIVSLMNGRPQSSSGPITPF